LRIVPRMSRRRYPSDLTDAQWERLQPLLESARSRRGRPRTYALREIVNALLYVLRGGIAWRALPHDFPPWQSVYDHFRRWKKTSTLEKIHDVLREDTRRKQGRARSPSAAVLDSQSVKTAGKRGMPTAMMPASRSPDVSGTSW
jgi:putative transposase